MARGWKRDKRGRDISINIRTNLTQRCAGTRGPIWVNIGGGGEGNIDGEVNTIRSVKQIVDKVYKQKCLRW